MHAKESQIRFVNRKGIGHRFWDTYRVNLINYLEKRKTLTGTNYARSFEDCTEGETGNIGTQKSVFPKEP